MGIILAIIFGYILIIAIALPIGVALGILWIIFHMIASLSPSHRRRARIRRYYAHPERYNKW